MNHVCETIPSVPYKSLMMSASPKIFKIGYYEERIVIVERSNLGYLGGKPRHVTMIFSDKTGLYNSLYYLNNTKCQCPTLFY